MFGWFKKRRTPESENKWLPGLERDNRYVAAFVLPGASIRGIKVMDTPP